MAFSALKASNTVSNSDVTRLLNYDCHSGHRSSKMVPPVVSCSITAAMSRSGGTNAVLSTSTAESFSLVLMYSLHGRHRIIKAAWSAPRRAPLHHFRTAHCESPPVPAIVNGLDPINLVDLVLGFSMNWWAKTMVMMSLEFFELVTVHQTSTERHLRARSFAGMFLPKLSRKLRTHKSPPIEGKNTIRFCWH